MRPLWILSFFFLQQRKLGEGDSPAPEAKGPGGEKIIDAEFESNSFGGRPSAVIRQRSTVNRQRSTGKVAVDSARPLGTMTSQTY